MGVLLESILHWRLRLIVFISAVVLCINCIDPYTPNLENFESLLVVDALITDEDGANYVKLTRSSQNQDIIETVSGAQITITDDLGNVALLTEKNGGEYWTDSTTFRGEVGRSYTLHIIAGDEEYLSDPCLMYPSTEIDSLYFGYKEATPEGYSEDYSGIEISMDSDPGSASGFRRWTYEEWWKFRVPYPVTSEFISEDEIISIPKENETCYGHEVSDEIIIHAEGLDNRSILTKPILFRASQLTNRFQLQYSIEIKQLSISREEYEFWNNLKLLNDAGGDIFDKQPFSVVGNVKNVDDPSLNALGYFQVSAVAKKQIYITQKQIHALGLFRFQDGCERVTVTMKDYEFPVTWDYIYGNMVFSGYVLVGYEVNAASDLSALVFALPVCADCRELGVVTKPDFWVDL